MCLRLYLLGFECALSTFISSLNIVNALKFYSIIHIFSTLSPAFFSFVNANTVLYLIVFYKCYVFTVS